MLFHVLVAVLKAGKIHFIELHTSEILLFQYIINIKSKDFFTFLF